MSITTKLKSFLAAREPTAQLPEIRERLASAEADLAHIDGEITRRARPVLLGDAEAAAAIEALRRERAAIAERIDTLRRAEAECAATIRSAAEERRRATSLALPATLAELCERSLAADDEIMALSVDLADAIRRKQALDEEIARASGNAGFDRTRQRTSSLIRDAIANLFRIDPSGPNRVENNMLGLVSRLLGPQLGLSLRQLDEPRFDDLIPFYASEEAALAAQARLQARNCRTLVADKGKVWELIRHDELFVDRREADTAVAAAARRHLALVVVAHGNGFRVCPAGFADSAILDRPEAA
jgi:hypothetical protein